MKQINLHNPPDLTHLRRLTNFQGLIQHSKLRSPDKKHGYSIDDNARALILIFQYVETYGDKSVLPLAHIYFDYIKRAQLPDGRFHNFAKFSGEFNDGVGSEDSFGRTLWALGYIIGNRHIDPKLAKKAKKVFDAAQKHAKGVDILRTKSFTMLGYYFADNRTSVKHLANDLCQSYESFKTDDWHWFDKWVTYSNAILPYSLFLAYDLLEDDRYLKTAEETYKFLDTICRVRNIPAPIGQNGWYKKGGEKALYDQQLVDATDMILAAVAGYRITKNEEYLKSAKEWWNWFLGKNMQKVALIDSETGGCYDGLTPGGVNLNQGAESIVCYLLGYLAMAEEEMAN